MQDSIDNLSSPVGNLLRRCFLGTWMSHMYDQFSLFIYAQFFCPEVWIFLYVLCFSHLGFVLKFLIFAISLIKFLEGVWFLLFQLYLCVAFGFYMPWNDSFVMFSLGIIEETLLLLCSCYIMLSCTIICNVLRWFLF